MMLSLATPIPANPPPQPVPMPASLSYTDGTPTNTSSLVKQLEDLMGTIEDSFASTEETLSASAQSPRTQGKLRTEKDRRQKLLSQLSQMFALNGGSGTKTSPEVEESTMRSGGSKEDSRDLGDSIVSNEGTTEWKHSTLLRLRKFLRKQYRIRKSKLVDSAARDSSAPEELETDRKQLLQIGKDIRSIEFEIRLLSNQKTVVQHGKQNPSPTNANHDSADLLGSAGASEGGAWSGSWRGGGGAEAEGGGARGVVSEERAALRAVKRNLLNLYCDSPVAPIAETGDASDLSYNAGGASEQGSCSKPAVGEAAGQEAPALAAGSHGRFSGALDAPGAQVHPKPAEHAATAGGPAGGSGSRGLPPRAAGGAPAGTGTGKGLDDVDLARWASVALGGPSMSPVPPSASRASASPAASSAAGAISRPASPIPVVIPHRVLRQPPPASSLLSDGSSGLFTASPLPPAVTPAQLPTPSPEMPPAPAAATAAVLPFVFAAPAVDGASASGVAKCRRRLIAEISQGPQGSPVRDAAATTLAPRPDAAAWPEVATWQEVTTDSWPAPKVSAWPEAAPTMPLVGDAEIQAVLDASEMGADPVDAEQADLPREAAAQGETPDRSRSITQGENGEEVLLRTLRKILNKRGGSAGASPAQIGEEEGSVEELSLHCLGSLEHADGDEGDLSNSSFIEGMSLVEGFDQYDLDKPATPQGLGFVGFVGYVHQATPTGEPSKTVVKSLCGEFDRCVMEERGGRASPPGGKVAKSLFGA
ncbi:hypothetical protein T484DRAFT_1771569, partial [Baffinella frigidus]